MAIVEQILWHEANRYLGQEPNIRQALDALKDSSDFRWRVASFDMNLQTMNGMVERGLADPDLYSNLNQYMAMTERAEILSLEDLIHMYRTDPDIPNPIRGEINRTWQMIRNYIAQGASGFAFARTTRNPLRLSSGLLIEGTGLLMENLLHTPSLRQIFVLAFEEVLINQDPASPLLQDVLDWMRQDKPYFPPGAREKIEFYHHLRG